MTASELIVSLQAIIAKHGDLEIFRLDDGGVADITRIECIQKLALPPAFVIS